MALPNNKCDREMRKFTETDDSSVAVNTFNKSGLVNFEYDYVSLATDTTTDTYTFKSGGSGGTTEATIVITYTDSNKDTISTVEKT